MSTRSRLLVLAGLVLAVSGAIALRPNRVPVVSSLPGVAAPTSSTHAVAPIPRLVELGSDTCMPCKAMMPVLEALRREFKGRLQVDFIDVLKQPEQAAPFNIYAMPTQVFLDGAGREVYRHIGFFSKEDIIVTWNRLGVSLDASGGR